MDAGKEGLEAVEVLDHLSDTEAIGVEFCKEGSNPQCQNPLFLGGLGRELPRTPVGLASGS